jgi:hypothetical protein
MLISLFVAGLALLAQGGPIQTVAAARRDDTPPREHRSAPDSLRALRLARRAQESFEFTRKQYLPREWGVGSHHCDVRIGRWCVWNDETNDRVPPTESSRITQAREKLLAVLDSLGELYPGDEWVAAQRIRYLIEVKRYADAARVADRCTASGSAYRCRAFAGVALHDSGAVAAADSAFGAALAAMPDSVRCEWTDIRLLLDDEIHDRYERADCATRERIASVFWLLTTPLYLRDHDFRNEFLARVAENEMHRDSRTPMGSPTESAFRETTLRYGFDTWFVRDDPAPGSMQEPAIAGYREGGSGLNFVPAYDVFASPLDLRASDWDFKMRTARSLYGPRYARHFESLTPQIALFRRGDSALMIAAYALRDDTLLARHSLETGLFVVAADSDALGEPIGTVKLDADRTGLLSATTPWTPMIVSVELLDPKLKNAARQRIGVRPPPSIGRLGISDLLMFAPRSADSLPHRLDDALPLALHNEDIDRNKPLGLFWEAYGVRPAGESFTVSIGIERIQDGWMRRTAQRLHLATPFSPMKMQWTEVPDRGDGIASRSVTLDLSKLEPGRYEISLSVGTAEGLPLLVKRELTVRR